MQEANKTLSDDFWRNTSFRVEPWGNNYAAAIQVDENQEASSSEVDTLVETDNWKPQRPDPLPLPQKLIFMDGTRRIDLPLVGTEGNSIIYGAFGTVAVGAVVIDRLVPNANYSQINIHRIVGFSGNYEVPTVTRIPASMGSAAELVYQPVPPSSGNSPETRANIVQKAMLKAERKLAAQFLDADPNTLVIRDGSLPYDSPSTILGYIKTMYRNYLSEKYVSILKELALGERSPIFLIKKTDRPKWSWYLKSGNPKIVPEKLGYHALHGIVRLELDSEVPLEKARKIADCASILIPQYASHPCRDPRAPQNLNPVGALEKELGRRMGDKAIIERRLRTFLASLEKAEGRGQKAEGIEVL